MNEQKHSFIATAWSYAGPLVLILCSLFLLTTPWPFLAPLPALAVLGLLLIKKSEGVPYLFYGIVFLIPFGAYRGLGGEFNLVRLHWLLAIALMGFVLARILWQRRIPAELNQRTFWLLVALFYLINIFAAMNSAFPAVSATFMVLMVAAYLLVALGIMVLTRRGYARTLPRVIVLSVLIGAVLGILGFVFNVTLFVDPVSGRALGAAPDPNNMSLMIIYSLPMGIYLLLTARRPGARVLYLLVFVISIIGIMATFSRGGALVLCIALGLMLWEFREHISPRNLGLLTGLAGIGLALVIMFSPDAYNRRIQSIAKAEDTPMRRRASYLVVAKDLIAERPVLGSGPNTFSSLYAKTELGRKFKRSGTDGKRKAHNTYVEVLVGSGVAGFTAFMLILGYSLRSFSRAQKRFLRQGQSQMALLTAAYRTSYLTLLVYLLMFSDVMHKYLLLSLAVSQVALRLAEKGPEKGTVDA
jgi:O-antigen ligase